MDIQLEKIELMKQLLATEDVSVLKSIKKIFQKEKKDWWEALTTIQREAIEEGIRDIDNGNTYTYEEVKKQFNWK